MESGKINNLSQKKIKFLEERADLACAFRWAAKMELHEGIANHFSLSVNDSGTSFIMNDNKQHFSLIRASDLLLLDANDSTTMKQSESPDPTAWGLHGAIHRYCPHARCIMHLHPMYTTVLASLSDSSLPPIDQRTVMFYKRYIIDAEYGGLAFKDEGERCASQLNDQKVKVMIMGNHGLLVIGDDVADTFSRLYYFELAAETYIKALWTGKPLRIMSDKIANKTANELENYPEQSKIFFEDLKSILNAESPSYKH